MNETTNVVGYFNGNRWPIQLVISHLNITVTLDPGKYLVDRQGRKINDPFFETYAKNGQLHRETSQTPVPLFLIPPVQAPTLPTAQSNPVRSVTNFTRDGRGVRQPVLHEAAPAPATIPPVVLNSASESVRPMTMQQARELGLARKTVNVPEDYGVTDTSGVPPAGRDIPRLRVAIDPSMMKTAPPLPSELTTMPASDPNRIVRNQIVTGLAQGATVPAADATTNPFGNAAVANVPTAPGANVVPAAAHTPVVPAVAAASPEVEVLTESREIQEADSVLPEPQMDDTPEPQVPPAAPPVVPAARPPTRPAAPAMPTALRPMTPANQFVCIGCGAPFRFRSQLQKHAEIKHADRVTAIMSAYPETAA